MNQAFHMLLHLIPRTFPGNGYYYAHFHVKKPVSKSLGNAPVCGFEPQFLVSVLPCSSCSFYVLRKEISHHHPKRVGSKTSLNITYLLLTFELHKCFIFFEKEHQQGK